MRIAFMVNKFPSLSETFILEQMISLVERGHELEIIANQLETEGAEHPEVSVHRLRELVTELDRIPRGLVRKLPAGAGWCLRLVRRDPRAAFSIFNLPLLTSPARSFQTLRLGSALADKRPFDIIHAHYGTNGLLAAGARALLKMPAPLVTSFYGFDLSLLPGREKSGFYGPLFGEGALMIALSRNFQDRLIALGCPREKTLIQRLRVNLAKFRFEERTPPKNNEVRLLSVARLVEKKGLEFAVRAVARAAAARPGLSIKYAIVGEGPLQARLAGLIRELELDDVVSIHGWLSHRDLPGLLSESHLFLLPSVKAADGDEEGTPVSIMEALASGMPVLSTLHSGIPEVVEDGKSGFLVPERDVEALTERLLHLLDHPERWPEMGRSGRRKIEREYSRENLGESLEEIYRGLLSPGPAALRSGH